jgi:hypothetical protein
MLFSNFCKNYAWRGKNQRYVTVRYYKGNKTVLKAIIRRAKNVKVDDNIRHRPTGKSGFYKGASTEEDNKRSQYGTKFVTFM